MRKLACSMCVGIGMLVACAPLAHAQSQSWDKVLPASKRFVVLDAFGGAAVLDKETGLVWARTPLDINGDGLFNSADRVSWFAAQAACGRAEIGSRGGWRLPTLEELGSLVDRSVPYPGPALPPGHPFDASDASALWTASTFALTPDLAYLVFLSEGGIANVGSKSDLVLRGWCVRGGVGVDPR